MDIFEELINLYQEAFNHDSKHSATWFVDNASSNMDNILIKKQHNQIVSCGYIVEKSAVIFNKVTPFPYLSALATKKEYRGKGLIRTIIKEGLNKMYKRGCMFSALVPFDYDYYKRFDYFDASFCKRTKILGGTNYKSRVADFNDLSILSKIENEMRAGFDNYLIREEKFSREIMQEYKMDEIDCKIYYDNDVPFAYAFSNGIALERFAFADINKFYLIEDLKGQKFEDFTKYDGAFVQARVINAKMAIENAIYNKKIKNIFKIRINDELIIDNNIILKVSLQDGQAKVEMCDTFDYDLNIDMLGDMLLNGDSEITVKQKNIFTDKY